MPTPSPLTGTPATTDALPPALRARVGRAWGEVRRAEAGARSAWVALEARAPIAQGAQATLLQLARRAAALVDGDASRLARVLRQQRVPWDLSAEPLRGVLKLIDQFEARARELAQLIDDREALGERLANLRATYAEALPKAWSRWAGRSGVDEAAIHACRSRGMLESLGYWIDLGQEEFERWKADIEAWMKSAGVAVRPSGVYTGSQGEYAQLEHRYELLLAVSVIDRAPLRRAVTKHLRRGVRTYLDVRVDPADERLADPVPVLARQYSESEDGAIGLDEAWTYREMITDLHGYKRTGMRR